MKKKSRFLQTPIEPFAVEAGLSADALLARMERISFQGRNLATAHRIWQKMLQDDVTIFLGMAGALSAGGLRLIVAHLILERYVDCLVSTGANLYHDLHETRGQHHYVGSPHADDAALAEDRVDRVYDTYASEEEFISNDNWIADFACTLDRRAYTTREFLHLLGGHLAFRNRRLVILADGRKAPVERFLRDFLQQHRNARVGVVHGDAATHGARADDGSGADFERGRIPGDVGNFRNLALREEQLHHGAGFGG